MKRSKESFKKDINRDVTQTDQKEARTSKQNKKRYRGKSDTSTNGSQGTKGGPEKGRQGYYSYRDQDYSWYNTKPELLNAANRIPFAYWAGDKISWTSAAGAKLGSTYPGVLALDIVPTLGSEILPTDPVNVAGEKLWSYIFHTVSGQAFADSPDLMIYLLGMCDVYSAIVWVERVYGEVNLWNDESGYMPEAYSNAEYIDLMDIRNNKMDYAARINSLIDMAAALCVPKQFTLFQRRAFLYDKIYTEGISPKSQQYLLRPAGFLKYKLNTTTKAGQLDFQPLASTVTSLGVILTKIEDMIVSLLSDQDTKKLSSLVMRAFGTDGIIKLSPMPIDYRTSIVYSLEVLEQIKNAEVVPYNILDLNTLSVLQDPATVTLKYSIMCRPKSYNATLYKQITALATAPKILTTGVAVPTPEVTVENTRFKNVYGFLQSTPPMETGFAIIPASEMCVGWRIVYSNWSDNGKMAVISGDYCLKVVNDSGNYSQIFERLQRELSFTQCFKFMPALALMLVTTTDQYLGVNGYLPILDVDNWTVVEPETLLNLNRVVMRCLTDNTTVARAWNGN